jgi:hypothetical protein
MSLPETGKHALKRAANKKKKKEIKFLTISKSYLPLQSQQTGSHLTDVKTGKTNKIETENLAKQTRRKTLGNTR